MRCATVALPLLAACVGGPAPVAPPLAPSASGATLRTDPRASAVLEGWLQATEGATGAETLALLQTALPSASSTDFEVPLRHVTPPGQPVPPAASPLTYAEAGGIAAWRSLTLETDALPSRVLVQLIDVATGKVRGQAVVQSRGDFRLAWPTRETDTRLMVQATAVRPDNRIAGFLATPFRARDFRDRHQLPLVLSPGSTTLALLHMRLSIPAAGFRVETGFRGLASARLASLVDAGDATASARLGQRLQPAEGSVACARELMDMAAGQAAALASGIDTLAGRIQASPPARKTFALALSAAMAVLDRLEEDQTALDRLREQTPKPWGCTEESADAGPSPDSPGTWLTAEDESAARAALARLDDAVLPD
ncbi:MAG: hypothetical protein VKO21_10580 [Candidatus Sericytochromatia bacterium]|nr:hypothetical protein [Candidatus Sericytochromatia bacterium]